MKIVLGILVVLQDQQNAHARVARLAQTPVDQRGTGGAASAPR
eukprot:COSAG02_NODE_58641_length_276_cov_1.457627_1_plen_42_part_01